MKKKITLMICFLIVFLMFNGTTVFAFAQQNSLSIEKTGCDVTYSNNNPNIEKIISDMEEYLKEHNTNVIEQLNKSIQYYENMLKNEESPEERAKIQALIDTTKNLIKDWKKYKRQQRIQSYFDTVKIVLAEW